MLLSAPARTTQDGRRSGDLLPNLVLLGGAIAVALLLSELLCAAFAPSEHVTTDILGRAIRNRAQARYYPLLHDGESYWDLVPNQSGRERLLDDYDYYWSINSLGLRSSEPPDPAARFYRILVLGDSQTFGMGVNQSAVFPARVESLLGAADGMPVRVFNAGVPGYGTYEELWKLERIAPLVKPDLVVVTCYIDNALVPDEGNDLWNNHDRMTGRKAAGQKADVRFLADHSHLYGFLSQLKQRLHLEDSLMDRVRNYRSGGETHALQTVWDRTRSLLTDIASVADRNGGARTIILYLPGLPSLDLEDRSAFDELAKTGIPAVSAFEALRWEEQRGHLNVIFRHDRHYNEKAHDLIAQSLAAFISDQRRAARSEPVLPAGRMRKRTSPRALEHMVRSL